MLNPIEIAAIVTAISAAIAQDKSIAELNILSAIFAQIGDTLAMIAIQTANIEEYCGKKPQNSPTLPATEDFLINELVP